MQRLNTIEESHPVHVVEEDSSTDDDDYLPDIVIESDDNEEQEIIDLTEKRRETGVASGNQGGNIFIDLTEKTSEENPDDTLEMDEDEDLIIKNDEIVNLVANVYEEIPNDIYWLSLLSALENCKTFDELE